ncbi:MAG: hypothetical protein A3B11_01855 [Candidatus Taylorbacteria bacterium RIFCSPLOWO2_01_FULL_44_26]|uniref:DUF7282 domain-containing protein n=2 Tax=Candidatus Tayloriibacteriota TaxID=1817919 RepID=A0A1G2MJB8_9BACT|nr:MAG: hypothetical protein A3D50_02035 [Candidatus Taylorbacteria bacterium RIFCSPHIGHO2_02_FULL_44_12]OHA31418.1 MAG: hypothetical protein A3B11_01855 [Candidatus Taylorbacteria bacterium RIFCSPLOWO2_01_FULL_44_26]
MEPQTGIKTWQWVVTVIVIIALIVIGIMVFGGNKASAPTTIEDSSNITSDNNTGEINRIVMSDQYPGNVVYVSSVQLARPGWVVIHTNENGKPGKVIGSSYFEAGINPGRITLTQPAVEGGTYYAMLHTDDGDKKFNETTDVALKDASGNIIMKLFRVSASVGEEFKG